MSYTLSIVCSVKKIGKQPVGLGKQDGYASVLILFFFAAIMLAVYSLYDSGWVATERIRLQNTADNTVYSVVNTQTRDHNMIAITNRAMVANQVAIGQYIGLVSWSSAVNEFAQNIETLGDLAELFPGVGTVIARITDVIARVTATMVSVLERGSGFIALQEGIITALGGLQLANHGMTLGSAQAVYEDILTRNDPDVDNSVILSAFNVKAFFDNWNTTIASYDRDKVKQSRFGGNEKTTQRFFEFGNLVNDSRDGFSAQRSYRWFGRFNLGIMSAWAEKNGGSDFFAMPPDGTRRRNAVHWNWTAADTISAWQRWRYIFGSTTTELPLGWGAAHALNKDISGNTFGYYSDRALRNSMQHTHTANNNWQNVNYNSNGNLRGWGAASSNNNAFRMLRLPAIGGHRSESYEENNIKDTTGLIDFHDLTSDKKVDEMPAFTLFISKPASALRLRRNIEADATDFTRSSTFDIAETGSVPSNRLYAMASAKSYFARPQEPAVRGRTAPWQIQWGRHDGLREYANLYNPFWQTTLAPSEQAALPVLVDKVF
ncbi:Putative Flp pilus-assembly TadE/G-like [Rheinheimera pacifica]|uniref:Putative Flp pilus-assembly TadE/G-like n=1 Tax=Rheinheimera pacifica TaxID=173990 RepID=A0A1H6L432_9GAMM|nr:pilus assembly protein TadG-related protein [Rheinheimera pacifica]SEH80988.1 Putative Flp pilus-assembly TadE/G-like [Rheinheimera pacifica]